LANGLATTAGTPRQFQRPIYYVVLQFVVRHVEFRRAHPPTHRDPGGVYGLGVAGDQGMPPIEVVSLGQQHIGTGRRKPFDLFEAFGRQLDAIINQFQPMLIIAAAASLAVQQSATNIGVKGLDGRFFFLELVEATAATAVAEAFSFQISHLTQ